MMQIDLGYLIVTLIGWIAWQATIEFRIRGLKESHKDNTTAMWMEIKALTTSLQGINLSLGRIEGRLGVNKNDL